MKEYDSETKAFLEGFNQRLKSLREANGYSYKKLEELTGISRSTLQRYETNPYAGIPANKMQAIADAYGVTTSYLMGFESKDIPYKYYQNIESLIQELGYSIKYDSDTEKFTIKSDYSSYPVSVEQLKNLKETTLSFLKFKIHEIANSSPAD